MPNNKKDLGEEAVERLLAEFNEELRCTGKPNFALLDQCPLHSKKELRSLMNIALLAHRALQPERDARQSTETALAG